MDSELCFEGHIQWLVGTFRRRLDSELKKKSPGAGLKSQEGEPINVQNMVCATFVTKAYSMPQ